MTVQQPDPKTQLAAFLSRFSPESVALVNGSLTKLRRAFPGAYELVYDYRSSVVVSFSPNEHGYEGVIALAVDPRGVRLYLDKSLPDPKGLLEGAGSKVRSVALAAASDLDRGDIGALVKAAIKLAGGAFSRAGSSRMIIKSDSKKKTSAAKKAKKKSPKRAVSKRSKA